MSKKLRCFLKKFTQLTKILHDRRSRRSRQIPSLHYVTHNMCALYKTCVNITWPQVAEGCLPGPGQEGGPEPRLRCLQWVHSSHGWSGGGGAGLIWWSLFCWALSIAIFRYIVRSNFTFLFVEWMIVQQTRKKVQVSRASVCNRRLANLFSFFFERMNT